MHNWKGSRREHRGRNSDRSSSGNQYSRKGRVSPARFRKPLYPGTQVIGIGEQGGAQRERRNWSTEPAHAYKSRGQAKSALGRTAGREIVSSPFRHPSPGRIQRFESTEAGENVGRKGDQQPL